MSRWSLIGILSTRTTRKQTPPAVEYLLRGAYQAGDRRGDIVPGEILAPTRT